MCVMRAAEDFFCSADNKTVLYRKDDTSGTTDIHRKGGIVGIEAMNESTVLGCIEYRDKPSVDTCLQYILMFIS